MATKKSHYDLQINEHDDRHVTLIVEPLERGYGITLGSTMRRLLLTAIPGAAITSIKVDGVLHEFSTIPGVIDDVADMVLNLKQTRFKLNELKPDPVTVVLTGDGIIKAGEIGKETDQFEVLNPELEICTLNGEHEVKMEVRVSRGKGYVSAETNKLPDAPIGTMFLDAIYSPVIKVTFDVQPLAASKIQEERLTLDVHTDGSTSPKDAVNYAASLLRGLADVFTFEESVPIAEVEDKIDDRDIQLRSLLKKSIDEMELSVRSHNCLQAAGIKTIFELVTKEENEMLKFKNFGRKSLTELQEKLGEMGLYFGMKIDSNLIES
jgi:DNA-directed RNA polymerase subunit alpha